jgi:hypothetical protein
VATTSVPNESNETPRLAVRTIPSVAKAKAVATLSEKLQDRDFTKPAADSLARAAVDPADFRRRLDRPAPVRVPGALLWIVETDVWTPTVSPYVVNYREADSRVFPADEAASASDHPPIRRPSGDRNGRPMLDIDVQNRDHLIHAVEASIDYLVQHNPLEDSIAERGVMFPITLVSTIVRGADGHPVAIPSTADGSSRAANALAVLGLSGADVLGKFRRDPRALSGLVGHLRGVLERPLTEIPEDDLGKANALILPARIVVGFEPDPSGTADFAKAVHNYVALIHGDLPPKAWPETARVDAKADSVVAELEQVEILTPTRARYFEGMLSPSEARKKRLPAAADERGLVIVSLLTSKQGGVHAAIRRGIVQRTERKNLTKGVKAELCAELALRGVRSMLSPKEMSGSREVLEDIYQHPSIWEKNLKPGGIPPVELLQEALKERKTGKGGPATAELGALGGFWLTARRVLREARFFASQKVRDGRQPRSVLSALMDSEWGLQMLARAVSDGREGDVIWHVDSEGKRVKDAHGKFLEASNDLIRGSIVPPPGKGPEPGEGNDEEDVGDDYVPPSPERQLMDRRNALEAAVELLEQRHSELRELTAPDGEPLVDKKGISSTVAEELRNRLEAIRTQLALYSMLWGLRSESANGESDAVEVADTNGEEL